MKINFKKVLTTLAIASLAVVITSIPVLADMASPEPLVNASDLQIVQDFGADAKATIPVMLSVIIPLSLGITMLPLFIHKGIGWIMGAVRRS